MSNQNTFSKTSGKTEDIDKEVQNLMKKRALKTGKIISLEMMMIQMMITHIIMITMKKSNFFPL